MSDTQLPLLINPRQLAERNVKFEGRLKASLFPRFANNCDGNSGDENESKKSSFISENDKFGALSDVDVRIHFYTDEQGSRVIDGNANASVKMTCQRCLQELSQCLDTAWTLGAVINDEQAESLPSIYEPYYQEGAKMSLVELVENELLLAVPVVALHDNCEAVDFSQVELVIEEKPNPFAVLEALKKK